MAGQVDLSHAGIRTPDHAARSLVAVLTDVSRLVFPLSVRIRFCVRIYGKILRLVELSNQVSIGDFTRIF